MTWKMQGPSWIQANDERLIVMRRMGTLGDGVRYEGGKLVRDTGTIRLFHCQCNIQPLTGKDLLILPEGERYDDQLWLWSNQQDEAIAINDTVLREGRTYQVQSCEEWGSYNRARLVLDDTLPELD